MIVRGERPADVPAVEHVVAAAFGDPADPPEEVALLRRLRNDIGWIGRLSLVATTADAPTVVGHVVCSRGSLGGRPALGLGPIGVSPAVQGIGVGSALVHAVVGAANALGEEAIVLLGEPGFYGRFGFVPARWHGVGSPDRRWGDYFQVRPLDAFSGVGGAFRYADAFGV